MENHDKTFYIGQGVGRLITWAKTWIGSDLFCGSSVQKTMCLISILHIRKQHKTVATLSNF